PVLTEWFVIDLEDLTRSFAAVMLVMLALGPAALLVSAVLRLRGEEQAGRLEGLLVTGSARASVLGGWVAVVTALTLGTLVLLGLGLGLGILAATGEAGWVGELTLASLAYL